ncbi:unnamed protein product [Oreochromis niloticus]|nr:unnamed protein product [Mustela putorius furo]
MVESLLSPAADIVKRLSPEATPETYLQLLDAAFGTVEDGEELFAQFMNTLQDPGEKASSYLCRLQAVLNLAVKRGGIAAEEADKYILKQFCRGCWDNILLSDLNLEEKKSHPPAFAELLLQIRTEEDRHAAKVTRMKKHLGSNRQRAIEPLYDLLEVEGANGLPVPYLGYIKITITFPEQFLGKECDVPTLALVVPDSGTSGFHVLIGTNTLDVAYNMHKEKGPVIHHTSADGYKTVLKVLQLRHEQCHDSNIGVVRMHGKEKKVVPAGETVVLEGTVAVKGFQSEKCAIVEYPTSSLPGGLLVKACLLNIPTRSPCRLPVVISNASEHDITIPAKSVIAELNAIQAILPHKQSATEGQEPTKLPGSKSPDQPELKEWDRIRRFTQHHLSHPGDIEVVNPEVVQAICERQLIYCADNAMDCDGSISLVESLAISADAVPDSFGHEDGLGGLPIIPNLSEEDLRDKQRADQCIKHVISQIEHGVKPPPSLRTEHPDLPLLLRELNKFELRNGILYRTRLEEGHPQHQLVLPEELRDVVLRSLHDDMGHTGKERTVDLVRARFYWPRMASDIEKKIRTCTRVLVRNVRIRGKHKLADKWESTVHVVVKKAGDLPVYTVRPENGEGPKRTLHRDLLLPCGFLAAPTEERAQPKRARKPRTRQNTPNSTTELDQSSDEEDIVPIAWLEIQPLSETTGGAATQNAPRDLGSSHGKNNLTSVSAESTDVPEVANVMPDVTSIYHETDQCGDEQTPDDGQTSPPAADVPAPELHESVGEAKMDDSASTESEGQRTPLDDSSGEEELLNEVKDLSEDQPKEIPVLPDRLEDVMNDPGTGGQEESGEVEERADTDIHVRRSERDRQPPMRLDYTELGKPIVTVVKSFFQGLTDVWNDMVDYPWS